MDAFQEIAKGISGLQRVHNRSMDYAGQLMDFRSPFYQQFASYANQAIPGVRDPLSMVRAGGGNFGASMIQSNILRRAMGSERRDSINNMLRAFASGNIGYATNLIGTAGSASSSIGQLGLGMRQADVQAEGQEQGSMDWLSAPLGTALSYGVGLALAPATGGASMALPAMASDIKVKENIKYTGEETKDGIPIAEFNFIGGTIKYKGVIAQDVEKIRPDAVTEINGIKHVYYGVL